MLGGAWKKTIAVSAATALIVAGGSAAAPSAHARRTVSLNALERGVLGDVNAIRRSAHLAPLTVSAGLTAAAVQHSNEMAHLGYFAHSSADGTSFDKRIARYFPYRSRYWSVGENLVFGSPDLTAAQALDLWMHSPEHRQNLLTARWRQIGISAVHVAAAPGPYAGEPTTIITTDFGTRR